MLKGIQLADRISVPTSRVINDQGQMIVPCKFARTGEQLYTAGQLGLTDEDPKKIVTVYRDEKEVFEDSSMESFRSAPVTIGHPKDADGNAIKVTSKNSKELQVGALEGMPVRDEDTLGGTLVLTAQEAIDSLEEGNQELSAGYTCDIEEVDGKYYQRNIKANHIAIVAKGRAGSSCRISDEALEVQEADKDKAVMVDEALLNDALEEVKTLKADLAVHKELVVDAKDIASKAQEEVKALKVELADAQIAASEGVVERCEVIEQARLIADMRDLHDKTTTQIKSLVVEDQMPNMKLEGKSEDYISAMFDMLVTDAEGETPMSKLIKLQETHVTVDAQTNVVDEAHKKMIEKNKSLFAK